VGDRARRRLATSFDELSPEQALIAKVALLSLRALRRSLFNDWGMEFRHETLRSVRDRLRGFAVVHFARMSVQEALMMVVAHLLMALISQAH